MSQKFYKGFAYNMMTLSEKGIEQIHETAKDSRLQNATMIITSPYGRALHSIVVCHGILMQHLLGIEHPENGKIEELVY